MKQDMIVILDLGSSENTKLARDIREMGVYSEIYPHDITAGELKALPNVKGVIINGGPNHVVCLLYTSEGAERNPFCFRMADHHVCVLRRNDGPENAGA